MLSPVHRRTLNRGARVRFLRRDKEGVASTVGTIMALLVFLAFMALITNSYVPAWMLDNEREHMNQVIDQFGQLKGKVDSMIVEQEVRGSGAIKMYAPVTLGSSGVPLFATPTIGLMTYVPQGINTSGIRVQFAYDTSGPDVPVDVYGGGKVDIYVPNRYYVQQWVCYENGAIIVKQEDGQTVRAFPSLDVEKVGGKINIAFTQVDLIGLNQSLSGSDSVGLNIDLIYIDAQTYTVGGDGTWKLTMNTTYGAAWERFFRDTMAKSGLVEGATGDYTLLNTALPNGVSRIYLELKNAGTLVYNRAYVSMSMQNN